MSIVFPIVRLIRDEERGFKPEVVSRKEFEILQYQYAACELAGVWAESKLGFREVTLPDIDHDPHRLMAILPQGAGADFAHACREFNEDRGIALRNGEIVSDYGYSWAPGGSQQGYGYYAPVAAWLITHRGGSVFLYRPHDEIEDDFHKWMEFWIAKPMPREWPAACKELAALITPFDTPVELHRRKRARARYGVFR